MITPRTLRGFRDLEPDQVRQRNAIVHQAQQLLERFAFNPIATPALEYAEVLLGKGGGETDKQVYRFEDGGSRDVAMRYDLTVPLARFTAERAGKLSLPFRAYQIGIVWRGEKAQRGRYREFMQCDFDVLGATSPVSDAEVLTVAATLVSNFFPGGFRVRVSDRKLLTGFIAGSGVTEGTGEVLRSLDKLPKQGHAATRAELLGLGISEADVERLLAFAALRGSAEHVRTKLTQLTDQPAVLERLDRLEETLHFVAASGIPADAIELDLSITRGLDYYTGLVFETFAQGHEGVGSICSGGRYDNLTGLYSKQVVPGVGGSVGVDRLLSLVEPTAAPSTQVLVAHLGQPRDAVRTSFELRQAGLVSEVFVDDAKLKAQLKFADRRQIPLVVVIGKDEVESGEVQLKDMRSGESRVVARASLAQACREQFLNAQDS